MNVRLIPVNLILILALAVAPRLAAGQKHVPMSDDEIQKLVAHKLSEKEIENVRVSVKNGVVTLSGTVPSAWAKDQAIDEAREIADVQSVISELTIARGENDQAIAREIARQIRRYVFYTIFDDVNIGVNNGIVTLTGRVTAPYKASEIARLAARAQGVQEVKNDIETLPVSSFDDQLRAAIASQIYRDPMFWNYAIQANPPIHIVVENSRVTLTGVVNSEIEKRKAEIIARSTFGVLGVENKLQVEGKGPSGERG